MPQIIYGTAWKKTDTANLVELAIRSGFRAIDTACQPKHYHEPGVGEGVARCLEDGVVERDGLYLQTKFTPLPGQDPNRIPYDPATSLSDQVAQSFDASLKNLRVDRLDALVLHSPLPTVEETLEVWQAMERLVDRGGVGQLGISNCYAPRLLEHLHQTTRVKPTIVQNRFYAQTGYDTEIRHFCRQQDMVYQSFWTLTANPHLLASGPVQTVATNRAWTPEQVLLRFLSQLGITPLTGTRSEKHMLEDLAVFEQSLDEAEMARLGGVF